MKIKRDVSSDVSAGKLPSCIDAFLHCAESIEQGVGEHEA